MGDTIAPYYCTDCENHIRTLYEGRCGCGSGRVIGAPVDPALQAKLDTALKALTDATAHLVGAASAYRKHAARHRSVGRATADPFFTTRAVDFEDAADRSREAISTIKGDTNG